MNLITLNNQFHYNLPPGFVPAEHEERYMKLLRSKRKLYSSVLDYLNSTIVSVTFPGLNFPLVSNPQKLHTKKILWKTVGNIFDLFDKEITVTFNNVDSNINYMIMLDILVSHYLNTDRSYDEPMIVTVLDEFRNAIYHIRYRDVMWTGLSNNTFAFNEQTLQSKTFTATFQYNFLDFEYTADKVDIISGESYGNLSNP